MSITSVFLFLSFLGYVASAAYEQTRLEFPLEQRGELVYKSDPRYAQILSTLPGSQVQSAMQAFLGEAGVRKDLRFSEVPNPEFGAAFGTNMWGNSDAVIALPLGFYEVDKDACSFVIKHEISHIKYNDSFTTPCFALVCQLAASIFGMCSLSFVPALRVALTVGIVSMLLFMRWREEQADDFTIENSSDEELKGGKRLFKAMQEAEIEERKTSFWNRIEISASGDVRFDLIHPSFTSRIKKIERTLRARNTNIDPEEEKWKLDDGGLKAYVKQKIRKMQQQFQLEL